VPGKFEIIHAIPTMQIFAGTAASDRYPGVQMKKVIDGEGEAL